MLRTLGKGGMATVYLASQDVLERRVALKVMSRNLAEDSAFGARFMREAKIVSQLVHPNIVTVHEVGQHEGRYFLSMEYIDGHDLRTVRKNLDLAGKLKVIEDIARALHYAGEKGYVHRDIKPENIMFREADGSAVLTDFGIAKAVENDLTMTQTGTAIGTPHYMSPEQAKGKDVDHRSDLYSLGVVFYLLLAGRVPFDADTAIAIGIKHLTEEVPRLPEKFASMQYIIDGLMAKNRNDRYQSGLHLLNDLRLIDLDRIDDDAFASNDQPTIAADVPTSFSEAPTGIGAEFEETARRDSKRFTIEFGVVEPSLEKQPRAILPVFFASLFILFSVAVFIYFARPAVLERQIVHIESLAGKAYRSVSSYAREGVSVAEDALGEMQREYDERSVSVNQSPEQEGSLEAAQKVDETISKIESTPGDSGAQAEKKDTFVSDVKALERDILEKDNSALPEVEVPRLDDLLLALSNIKEKRLRDSALLPDEVLAHREILTHYPNHQPTLSSLVSLKAQQENEAIKLAKKGDRERVTRRFNKLTAVFSEEYSESESKRLFEDLDKHLTIFELLQRAKIQSKNNQLASPVNDNTIDSLKSVLALDPKNSAAITRLDQLAEGFYSRAKRAFKKAKVVSAKDLNNIALQANAKYQPAQALARDISEFEQQRRRLTDALDDAKRYAELGYLYTPEGANAYDAYKRALQLDPESSVAQRGLAELMDKLSVQVWDLVGEAQFEQAKLKLKRPLILMPNNERILAIQAAVDDVAEGN